MKRKMKRILAVAITLTMLVELLPMTAWAEERPTSGMCGENVRWEFNKSSGVLTISGSGEMYDFAEVTPWLYDSSIIEVVIRDGVTSIGQDSFFGLSGLKKLLSPIVYIASMQDGHLLIVAHWRALPFLKV